MTDRRVRRTRLRRDWRLLEWLSQVRLVSGTRSDEQAANALRSTRPAPANEPEPEGRTPEATAGEQPTAAARTRWPIAFARRGPRRFSLGRRRAIADVVVGAIVAGLLVVGVLQGANWAKSDKTCLGCHEWIEGSPEPHGSVQCVSCHRGAGPIAMARFVVGYARMLSSETGSGVKASKIPRPIDEDGCRECHRATLEAGAEAGDSVRAYHGHLQEAGLACRRCHDGVGHAGSRFDRDASVMTLCLRCHDGERGRSDCGVCHIRKPSDVASDWRPHTPVRTAMGDSCGGCHAKSTAAECVRCHGGYEMPHPEGWVQGGHIFDGFVDQDDCMICHERPKDVPPAPHGSPTAMYGGGFCNRCHTFPSPHGDNKRWIRLHGPASKGVTVAQPACRDCHNDQQVALCTVCHNPFTCIRCHADRDERRGRLID